jgi:hypothetical protein
LGQARTGTHSRDALAKLSDADQTTTLRIAKVGTSIHSTPHKSVRLPLHPPLLLAISSGRASQLTVFPRSSISFTMGDADVTNTAWRLVEVGRVVLFTSGPYAEKLAAIVEIIDHKRVCLPPSRPLLQICSLSPTRADTTPPLAQGAHILQNPTTHSEPNG